MDQLLGVNDTDVAVGFWTDANGNNHGYQVNINTGTFSPVTDPNAPGASLTAAAINNRGDIAGFYTSRHREHRRLPRGGRHVHRPVRARRVVHMALGVNDNDEVVGAYTAGSGSSAANARVHLDAGRRLPDRRRPARHGHHHDQRRERRRRPGRVLHRRAGNTDGMLATPEGTPLAVPLTPMPQGTVTFGRDGSGAVDAAITVTGLTPGSSHTVELVNGPAA